jgi:uncharacterized membrane protein YdbT with pleckstrin-like domain
MSKEEKAEEVKEVAREVGEDAEKKEILWQDKKRPFFGLPLSFTKYTLWTDKLLIDKGFFVRKQNEVRLYRIVDFSVRQNIIQRIFGVGDIVVSSSDNSEADFVIKEVKKPYQVKDMISDRVEKERVKNKVIAGEFLK